MPWLLAMLATSIPPAASAVSADGRRAERELLRRGVAALGDRGLEVGDREVGGGEHRRDRREHRRRVGGELVAQLAFEVDVARERERHRLAAAAPAGRSWSAPRSSVASSWSSSSVRAERCPTRRRRRVVEVVLPQQHAGRDGARDEERREDRRRGSAGASRASYRPTSPVAIAPFERAPVRTLTPMRVPELTPRAFRRLTLLQPRVARDHHRDRRGRALDRLRARLPRLAELQRRELRERRHAVTRRSSSSTGCSRA